MGHRKSRLRNSLPASRGTAWLLESLALLKSQAGRLLLIAVLMQVILGLAQVPLIGILVVISVPGLGAGILEAFHVTSKSAAPSPGLLFKPLVSGTRRGRLFAMGAMVFVIGVVTISVLLPASGNLPDEELLLRLQQGDVDALSQLDPAFIRGLMMAFMVSLGISGTLTFMSIPLVWFHDRRLWLAIVEGLRALITHWKPFLVLGLGVLVVFFPVALLAGMLLQLAAAGGVIAFIATVLVMMLLLAFQMVLFGTQYCASMEIFGSPGDDSKAAETGGDGQLVA